MKKNMKIKRKREKDMGLKTILENKEANRNSRTPVNILCENCGNTWTTTLGKICQIYETGNEFSTICSMCRAGKQIKGQQPTVIGNRRTFPAPMPTEEEREVNTTSEKIKTIKKKNRNKK